MPTPEGFTRRALLARTALGLTGGALASLLAACSSAAPSISAPTSAAASTTAAAPVVPSKENGGLGADGKTVTYKLKPGIKWADGQPFTADDVVFTFQCIADTA